MPTLKTRGRIAVAAAAVVAAVAAALLLVTRPWADAAAEPDDVLPYSLLTGSEGDLAALAVNPAGTMLAGGGKDGVVRVWDPATGEMLSEHEFGGTVRGLAFSPDGDLLAAGGENCRTRLWNLRTGKAPVTLRDPGREDLCDVRAVAFDPSGELLATGLGYGVRVWDVSSRRSLWHEQLRDLVATVASVAFTADGKHLLGATAGGANSAVLRWRAALGGETGNFPGHRQNIADLEPVPGTSLVLTASTDETVGVLDIATGRYTYLSGHGRPVLSVAASPDGRRAFSAGMDGGVRIWDLPAGAAAGTIAGPVYWPLAVFPDGRALAAGEAPGSGPAGVVLHRI